MRNQGHSWLLILGVLYTGGLQAQNTLTESEITPFVGEWTLDPTKSGRPDPERRIITRGPGWLRVELHRPGDDRPPVLLYKLDGSAHVGEFGSGSATTEIRREENGILTVTVFTVNDRPVTVQERLQITSDGDMTAAVLVRVEHGYEGVLPALEKQAPNVSQTFKHFRKAAAPARE